MSVITSVRLTDKCKSGGTVHIGEPSGNRLSYCWYLRVLVIYDARRHANFQHKREILVLSYFDELKHGCL